MRKRKYHGRRAMLNLPGHQTTASIVAEVEDTSTWKAGKNGGGSNLTTWNGEPEVNLSISDCDRKVSFDFNLTDEECVANSLYKLDTMIDALQKLRAGVAIEAARYADRLKTVKENEDA